MRVVSLLSLALFSTQALAWESTDGFYNHASSDSGDVDAQAHSFIDISGTGTVLPTISATDDAVETLPASASSFSFEFYGVEYAGNEITVASNGSVIFGATSTANYCCSAITMPSALFEDPTISVLQEDLNPAAAGNILFQVVGDELVIQYDNVPMFGSTRDIVAQLRLNGLTGEITVAHAEIDVASNTISVGMQRDSGTGINALVSNTPPSNTSYLFSPVDFVSTSTDAQDLVDYAVTVVPEIDSGLTRLSSANQIAKLGNVEDAALANGCLLTDAVAGNYAGGAATGSSDAAGDDTISGTFNLGARTFIGNIAGLPFGDDFSRFDKNLRLIAETDDGDVLVGRWTRIRGTRGIWIAGVYAGCPVDAFPKHL